MTNDRVYFWDMASYNGEFNQWYPCSITHNKVEYSSAGQYMMAMKAILFDDKSTLRKIRNTNDYAELLELGREVSPFNEATWNIFKRGIVKDASLLKFIQYESLRSSLLATGTKELVYVSPGDKIWGIGDCNEEKRHDSSNWDGQNLLGYTLMDVRATLSVYTFPMSTNPLTSVLMKTLGITEVGMYDGSTWFVYRGNAGEIENNGDGSISIVISGVDIRIQDIIDVYRAVTKLREQL